jgi:ubiquinone/menaquinone biosynthesis methyltransferase
MPEKNIYDSNYVEALFDKMSTSYNRMNYITSFGFSERWRRQCVEKLNIKDDSLTADLMTGMGECWKYILKKDNTKLLALDFSGEMIKRAQKRIDKHPGCSIQLLKENVFNNSIVAESVDFVVCGFGLKTFNEVQIADLAKEVKRILKPGGEFSFIEISVPKNIILRLLYMFYLNYIIPLLGFIFLGNPDSYRMLGVYTQYFNNARLSYQIFADSGFTVEFQDYFFACATGISGKKPKRATCD